jgi:hypothetical protein
MMHKAAAIEEWRVVSWHRRRVERWGLGELEGGLELEGFRFHRGNKLTSSETEEPRRLSLFSLVQPQA